MGDVDRAEARESFARLGTILEDLTIQTGDFANTADLTALAECLDRVRTFRRHVTDLEHQIERDVADQMFQDSVNLADEYTLERHRGHLRTKWQSTELLAQLGLQARIDANGVVHAPDEMFARFYEAVQDCVPLTPSLPWRAGALRERGIDPDEYAVVEPGRVSVSVKAKAD